MFCVNEVAPRVSCHLGGHGPEVVVQGFHLLQGILRSFLHGLRDLCRRILFAPFQECLDGDESEEGRAHGAPSLPKGLPRSSELP